MLGLDNKPIKKEAILFGQPLFILFIESMLRDLFLQFCHRHLAS